MVLESHYKKCQSLKENGIKCLKMVSTHLSRFHCFESETWSSSSFIMVKTRVNVNHLMPAFCEKETKEACVHPKWRNDIHVRSV